MSPAREGDAPGAGVPPWQVLIGPFDAEHIELELDRGSPLLLVPNNPELASELACQFQNREEGHLYFSRDLLGAEDREVCWYRYNDPRFDGASPPEALRDRATNLRLQDLELRRVVRLDSLIHGWANHDPALAELVSAGGGRVWVRSKLPVPIVAGVSRVVEVIGTFCWTPLGYLAQGDEPGVADPDLATVSAWLERSGYQSPVVRSIDAHSAAASLIWRQDPLWLEGQRREKLGLELAQLEAQKQALEAQVGDLSAEREALAAEREALAAESAARQAEGERLEAAKRELQEELRAREAGPALVGGPQGARRGDLRLGTDPEDPRCGTLLVLLSGPGEPEAWEAAVAAATDPVPTA
jgi:hypothetical protein